MSTIPPLDPNASFRASTQPGDSTAPGGPRTLDAERLRQMCLDAGADDVGFVDVDREDLGQEGRYAREAFPATRTLVSFVVRMNRGPIRSPARSVANLEFHHAGDAVNDTARRLVAALEQEGIEAINPAMGFPMEMDRFPGRTWVVSHKTIAVAAGLGHMGIHRSVIHPRFGSFVLLGTVLVEARVQEQGAPLEGSPCVSCKLCVAACPVGAIKADGALDFSACYTHNYREFMGGFSDWVESVAESRSAADYRARVTDAESASMWQSLSFGANYKAAYCLAVCPAGTDVIGSYLADRSAFRKRVMGPLLDKQETVYVLPGSDAESYVQRRFPHKPTRAVSGGLRPRDVEGFLSGLPLLFQPGQAAKLDATYHFCFTEGEVREATVVIREGTLKVSKGLMGRADLTVTADPAAWVGFLRKERRLLPALLTRRIRISGSPRLLLAFGKCFPA